MAGDVEHLKAKPGRLDDLSLADEAIGGWAANVHARQAAQIQHRVGEEFLVAGANYERGVRKFGLQIGVAGDMVDVSVRVQDQPNGQPLCGELLKHRLRL